MACSPPGPVQLGRADEGRVLDVERALESAPRARLVHPRRARVLQRVLVGRANIK